MPTRPRARLRLGLAAAAVLLLALGAAVPTVLAASRAVTIRDFAFSPRSVEIRVGDTVKWTNRDGVAHSAAARNGSFDTGLLEQGQSRSVRFTAAGTYRYICTPHPSMTGTVVVRAASGGVQPPQTDTAPSAVTDSDDDVSGGSPIAGLAAVGGLAFLLTRRAIARRRETTSLLRT